MAQPLIFHRVDFGYDELVRFTTWFKPNVIMAEIGSYSGESAEIFIQSKKVHTIFCIDPWENNYDKKDLASELNNMDFVESTFDNRMQKYNNYVKIKQKSEDAVKMFPNEFFDIVYIDGDHRKEAFIKDVKLWLPKLKHNGWLSGHDIQFDTIKAALKETIGRMPDAAFNEGSWVYLTKPTLL